MITLFHGSPHKIDDKLVPNIPRGSDAFQTQKAVFFTDIEKAAQCYALMRDKKRERKGWFIYQDQLHVLKPKSGESYLNRYGYVYVYSTRDYVTDDANPNQYAVLKKVKPHHRYVVRYEDISDNIVEYNDKNKWKKMGDKLLV